jgi:hypothetical protein
MDATVKGSVTVNGQVVVEDTKSIAEAIVAYKGRPSMRLGTKGQSILESIKKYSWLPYNLIPSLLTEMGHRGIVPPDSDERINLVDATARKYLDSHKTEKK